MSNTAGKLRYYCFRASCGLKGVKNTELRLDDIRAVVAPKPPQPLPLSATIGWTNDFSDHPEVIDYLTRNNCIEAYNAHPSRFFYDRIKSRVVFCEYASATSFYLATGRSTTGQTPKWFKYVALPNTYYLISNGVGNGETAVIVEDCASACSVSRVADGLALCGTNYNLLALCKKMPLAKDVVVCLDPDAQLKALKLSSGLQGLGNFRSVRTVLCRDDPKYLTKTELDLLIYG